MGKMRRPSDLVDEFKKSGDFDRLRRNLLERFQESGLKEELLVQVDASAHTVLDEMRDLDHKNNDAVYLTLSRDLERFPHIDRAISDFDYIDSQEWERRVERILRSLLKANKISLSDDDGDEESVEDEDNEEEEGEEEGGSELDEVEKVTEEKPGLGENLQPVSSSLSRAHENEKATSDAAVRSGGASDTKEMDETA